MLPYTEKELYYHKNITIRNCYFDKGLIAVLRHVENFVFEDNQSNGELSIQVEDCKDIHGDQVEQLIIK